MVVSKVSLSRQEELALVAPCEFRPTLAVGNSSVPSIDCGPFAVIAAALRHLCLRPAEHVAVSHLGVHCDGISSFDVVDTFPERCRRPSAYLR